MAYNLTPMQELVQKFRALRRNFAEHRLTATDAGFNILIEKSVKDTIDQTIGEIEMILAMQGVAEPAVETLRIPAPSAATPAAMAAAEAVRPLTETDQAVNNAPAPVIHAPEPAPAPAPAPVRTRPGQRAAAPAVDPAAVAAAAETAATARSAANEQRDREIKERLAQQAQQPSAIGANRDTVTRTPALHLPWEEIPESEKRTGNIDLPMIPGTRSRPVSPFQRLTEDEHSEFNKIFAQSPFLPTAHGPVPIPNQTFRWSADRDIHALTADEFVRLNTGFYGRNPEHGGPALLVIRGETAIIVWDLTYSDDGVRVFYVGRSNVTGYWLPPSALDVNEQLQTIAVIMDVRNRAIAAIKGVPYVPGPKLQA